MKWVTREHAMVDRIACSWLIRNFVDKEAEFLFVLAEKVLEAAQKESAIPYDVQGAELGHHGEVSFDAIIRKYNLTDPPLMSLASLPEYPGLLRQPL